MNITEYSKYLKSKFATVMGDWDKLTINQLEQIEQLLNNLTPPAEKKQESKPKTKVAHFKRPYGMNEAMYKEITELHSKGWTWNEVAKKLGYACGTSILNSYLRYKRKHNIQVTTEPTVPTVHFSNT